MRRRDALGLGALLAVALIASPSAAGEGAVDESCRFEGHPLWGKVKVVDSFPDVKVKMVDSFPDACGKWKMVDSFPDVKIKFVDSFPDVKIKYVDSFPGRP